MRRFKRSKKQLFIGIISSIILVLTIGYSFLSLNLRVLGLAHIGAVWNIHFDNITINPDSASLSAGDIEPEIDEDNDCKINYKVTLTPGDFYEFNFDIVNEGTIDGMIQNIITRIEEDATATFPSYIDYHISYSDDVILETNQQLLAGTTETLKVKVEFKDEENVPESETLDLSFENNYVKKTSSATKVKHPQPLYNVLQDEANSGSGLAIQYTGEHHDSFTEEPSKNIYHWYASNVTNATTVLDKNNVIFANHCWQMIRTTDTGGVKLLYNGEAENNQCLDTRSNHVGYYSSTDLAINNNIFWYGTDYVIDPSTNNFKLGGTVEQSAWNENTWSSLKGKYTCGSVNENDTCSVLHLILSYNDVFAKTAYINRNLNYSIIGSLSYSGDNFIASAGYMQGNSYSYTELSYESSISFEENHFLYSSGEYYSGFYYSDSISYDVNTGLYTLNNPISISDKNETIGKYTLRGNGITPSDKVYYIVGVHNTLMHFITLADGHMLSYYDSFDFGDSITDNLDGTYTINNIENVSLNDYLNNYLDYVNKYTCGFVNSNVCSEPKYVTVAYDNYFKYLPAGKKLLISKTRNGMTLTTPIIVSLIELLQNSANYSDYRFTCGNTSDTCTNINLSYILDYTQTGYKYISNRNWGESVSWDGTKYTLINPIGVENTINSTNLSSHHYMCYYGTSCTNVIYVYYLSNKKLYYVTLKNGTSSINQVLNDMFSNNIHDSKIKIGVDAWYKKYLMPYDNYIEDTIFCNNRNIVDYAGWKADGGNISSYSMKFRSLSAANTLSCPKVTDQFCTSNNQAQLTYKVALITRDEFGLTGRNIVPSSYYTLTPSTTNVNSSLVYYVNTDGYVHNSSNFNEGVRPSISLIPGIKYTDGDGSMANPYIIKTN